MKYLKLRTKDNVFSSYEYETLFGLIRIDQEAIYVMSVYNKNLNNGSFKPFIKMLERSRKPIIMLNVHNARLWHYFMHNGYRPHDGIVKDTLLQFPNSLIKQPK